MASSLPAPLAAASRLDRGFLLLLRLLLLLLLLRRSGTVGFRVSGCLRRPRRLGGCVRRLGSVGRAFGGSASGPRACRGRRGRLLLPRGLTAHVAVAVELAAAFHHEIRRCDVTVHPGCSEKLNAGMPDGYPPCAFPWRKRRQPPWLPPRRPSPRCTARWST